MSFYWNSIGTYRGVSGRGPSPNLWHDLPEDADNPRAPVIRAQSVAPRKSACARREEDKPLWLGEPRDGMNREQVARACSPGHRPQGGGTRARPKPQTTGIVNALAETASVRVET